MPTKATNDAEALLTEALRELESPKGSVTSAVQKLQRAAVIVGDHDTEAWCAIQLGDRKYTEHLARLLDLVVRPVDAKEKPDAKALAKVVADVKRLGLKQQQHWTEEELLLKYPPAGAGYAGIPFIEERYADLVRTKRGNDGTHHKIDLQKQISYVRRVAHERANRLHTRLAYAETPQSALDILKAAVDDRLLDVAPELAERLMTAFRGIASTNPEEWSQSLTSCRRFLEGIADLLYPPADTEAAGRQLGTKQYVNRLWAFMDKAIESDTNRELAKSHVDFLGSYLERLYRQSNKGVHAELTQTEAIKAVFHVYLAVADLLDYLAPPSVSRKGLLSIQSASLDELESVLGVSRSVAKGIVKARVESGAITPELLARIPGIGRRTLERVRSQVSFGESR